MAEPLPARAWRTYDRQWNRTGWAAEAQYPGQSSLTQDFPLTCECARPFCRVVMPQPGDAQRRYQAACSAGHWTLEQPIAALLTAQSGRGA